MNRQEWVLYVNRHINPESDLPRLDQEKLEKWQRLRLLIPINGEYHPGDLERTLALLMLERALAGEVGGGV